MRDFESIDFFKRKNKHYITDALTKTVIKSEILGYISYLIDNQEPFSLYFMDIDYFKSINDTFGHTVGDDALRKIADAINDNLDENAILGRFGGDEFVVVHKGVTDYDTKWQQGRKICLAVSNLNYDFGTGHLNQTTSITIGISSYPQDANTFAGIMETADKALYRGKQKGRNCFIIYDKAKHENLKIDEAQANVSKQLEMIFDSFSNTFITDPDKKLVDLATNLAEIYSIDRICLKTDEVFKVLYKNEDIGDVCSPIPMEKYNAIGYKNSNVLDINFRVHYEESDNELFKMLEEQRVNSQVIVRIKTHSNYYGYLRLDKFRETIWNADVNNVFQILASLYAIELENISKKD